MLVFQPCNEGIDMVFTINTHVKGNSYRSEKSARRTYTRSRLYGHRIYGLFGLYGQFLSGPNLPEYTKN